MPWIICDLAVRRIIVYTFRANAIVRLEARTKVNRVPSGTYSRYGRHKKLEKKKTRQISLVKKTQVA